MLSASLPSADAYDAFSLSPVTVVARVLASQRTSASRISSATASAVFAASTASRSQDAWLAQICDLRLVATREGIGEKQFPKVIAGVRSQVGIEVIKTPSQNAA